MTVKNEERYLRECLLSILQQTYENWELIVIDDNSTDNTHSILSAFQKQDKRISWHTTNGSGIIPALQLAFSLSKGMYITRMDGDDIMPTNKLAVLLELLTDQPKNVIATGKVSYFSNTSLSKGYVEYENWLNELCDTNAHFDWIYRECVVASPNWLCHREAITSIGQFDSLHYPEDYDLVLKWHQENFKLVAAPVVTHLWREHPERTSRNSLIYEQKSFFKLKLHYFIAQFSTKNIILIGKGQKANLCRDFLDANTKEYLHITLDTIESNLHYLKENATHSVVLLAIYPPKKERVLIEQTMNELGYSIGRNVFYV